jgi:hypothetical protein
VQQQRVQLQLQGVWLQDCWLLLLLFMMLGAV